MQLFTHNGIKKKKKARSCRGNLKIKTKCFIMHTKFSTHKPEWTGAGDCFTRNVTFNAQFHTWREHLDLPTFSEGILKGQLIKVLPGIFGCTLLVLQVFFINFLHQIQSYCVSTGKADNCLGPKASRGPQRANELQTWNHSDGSKCAKISNKGPPWEFLAWA